MVPPPKDNWRPSRPAGDDDWDDDIITFITSEARAPRAEVQRDIREEEEGEVGADDEEVRAEAGGGEVEGEGEEAVPHPRPAAARGPRRRPPREQWLLRQEDQGAGQPPQPVGDQDLQPEDQPIEVQNQQAPAQIMLQEEVDAQIQGRGITRGGRATKAPERYGFEKGRAEESMVNLNISATDIQRDLTPKGPSTASTPNISPVITPALTPVITPDTSPDTSAIVLNERQDWELPPDPDLSEGRTSKQRAEDVLERHRHWSDPGPDVRPQHPRFQDWDPGPAGRGAPSEL